MKWEEAEYFCPFCNSGDTAIESGAGDFYYGPVCLCVACRKTFTFPEAAGGAVADDDDLAAARGALK